MEKPLAGRKGRMKNAETVVQLLSGKGVQLQKILGVLASDISSHAKCGEVLIQILDPAGGGTDVKERHR
jgi:hypothetical protein